MFQYVLPENLTLSILRFFAFANAICQRYVKIPSFPIVFIHNFHARLLCDRSVAASFSPTINFYLKNASNQQLRSQSTGNHDKAFFTVLNTENMRVTFIDAIKVQTLQLHGRQLQIKYISIIDK